ncbi:long-chain-fatty-acid--CoA ligase [Caballeronia zhejiangensis]|uniref:long-chain-fatty-acid--CoA ligase n=1 Tax=Caballeronia zhejiangensis TaxID=871203 RepID=UPI001EF7226F|nr:long-chain-fatty-acid--CoA ligase [Caballeronia zhejiangensis]MCG7405283.1 long-chain-fatty-acid--CoA ligase [Caballeronia zhejiangensis]MCI1047365.1 long-chain-fatty-acid--CoA ligase [Caballeronia zhejiangensis]
MNKTWLASYPSGVPAEIESDRYRSVTDLLEQSFRLYAGKPAFACMGASISYAKLDALSRDLAAWLQSTGLRKGARVAIMMPNVLQYPVALAAILRAGYVVVNVNPLYTPRELEHQLKDSGAEAIILLDNFAATLQAVVHETTIRHVVVATLGDLLGAKGCLVNFVARHVKNLVPAWNLPGHTAFNAALARGRHTAFTPVEQQPDDVALLQYTGGTTGVAKGAVLPHRSLIANMLQTQAWLEPARAQRPTSGQLTTAIALPLYHVFALTACGLLTIQTGALGVLIPNPRDIGGMIRTLRRYRITMFPAVNTLYNAMLDHPDFAQLDCSRLFAAVGGGAPVQQAVAQRWLEKTGVPIIEGYGLTETTACVTCNPADSTQRGGTIGLPLPSTEVSIRDDAGNEAAPGEPGELCIRGPQVMAGYWNRPDETAHVMTADGFFKSGDIAVMDEHGFLKIVDRKKDMILVSGFNVYPNEIEDVVAAHPGVFEAAAVGVPDRDSGESVKIFVVRRDPALTEADLIAHCKERLTGYKRPKAVEFRESLPKSNIGKVLRRELRDGTA